MVVGQESGHYLHGAGGRPEHPDVRGTLTTSRATTPSTAVAHPVWTECPFTQSFRLTPSHAQAISGLFKTTIVGRNRQRPDCRPHLLDMSASPRLAAYRDLIQLYGPENVIFVAPAGNEQGARPHAVRNEPRGGAKAPRRDDAPYQRGKVRCFTFSSQGPVPRGRRLGADSFCRASRGRSRLPASCEQLVLLQHHNNCP